MIVAASFDIYNPEQWINRALSYGDGLFETMRLNKSRIPLLDFHLKRLAKGLGKLELNGFDRSNIEKALAKKNSVSQNAILKLVVFRANQARTYTPLTAEIEWLLTLEELPQTSAVTPLRIMLSEKSISRQPMLAGIKHLSRLEQVMLARDLNHHQGFDDLLIVDDKNRIIETSYQNVVLIKNGGLFTPKLDKSGVKGVALQWLKDTHEVSAQHIKVDDINEYDCMMVCNSIRGFRLVASIERYGKQCIWFGTKHDIHDKIAARWDILFKS